MSANNPLNIDLAGLSLEVTEAVGTLIAMLKASPDVSKANAAALELSEVVGALRQLNA